MVMAPSGGGDEHGPMSSSDPDSTLEGFTVASRFHAIKVSVLTDKGGEKVCKVKTLNIISG